MKARSFNNIVSGLIPGIITPAVLLAVIVIVRKNEYILSEYFKLIYDAGILPKLISICLIPNLLLFFIFIWSNRYLAARGVILSMFIAGLVIGILKII